MSKTVKLALAAITCAGLATTALAQGSAVEGAIKARQAHMQLLAFNTGVLGNMARGRTDYDAEAAQAAADNLVQLGNIEQTAYWPADSDSESAEGSKTLPIAWEDMAGLMEKNAAFLDAAVAVQAVAGGGLEGLQGAMGDLGKSCGGCHQTYRQSDN